MHLLLLNASAGRARRVREGGREYLVAPLTSIVPGVLSGSKGPLYYPEDEVSRNVGGWDGMPLTVYHPFDPATGAHLSASDPGVVERQGIGEVRKSTYNGKLRHEGWFDAERTKAVDPRVYRSLVSGKPVELSTGLYTDNELAPEGSHHNGKPYDYVARNYRPDHIAVLPDQTGACSIRDGCGVLVNKLDRQGGEMPVIGKQPLERADFVTYPDGVKGSNCGNCRYNDEGTCEHPTLNGQPVTDRNCCAYWDAPGTLRTWDDMNTNANPEGCNQYKVCGTGHDSFKGHPLAGKDKDKQIAEHAAAGSPTAKSNDPWKLDGGKPPKDHAKISEAVEKYVGGVKGFARATLPEAYKAASEAVPGLKMLDFQKSLVKSQGDGKIRLGAWTQAKATIPDPSVAFPLDYETKWYIQKGAKFVTSNAGDNMPQSTLERFVNWLVGNATPVQRGQDGKFGAGGQQQAPAQPAGKAPPLGPEDLEEGEEDEIKAKHGGSDDKDKATLAPDQGKGTKNMAGNMIPQGGTAPVAAPEPDAKAASKDAAMASMDHPPARDHAMKAMDFGNGGKSNLAAGRHDKAAEEHDDAATESRKGGDEAGAQDHENAAMLHRKASSMHSLAVRNAKKRDKDREDEDDDNDEDDVENKMGTYNKEFGSDDERRAAFAHMEAEGGEASKAATTASRSASQRKTSESHKEAARAHEKAGGAHRAGGNKDLANKHSTAAKEHAYKATIATNLGTDNMDRAGTIDHLTTNCPCWKGGGDVLNLMSDRQLASVARNAKAEGSNADVTGGSGSVQAGGEEDEDDHETADDHTSEDLFTDKVKIKKGKMSENRFLASLPPSYREAVVNAQEITKRERIKLVNRLIANVNGDEARRRIGARLMQKPLAELRDMLAMVPETAYNSEREDNVPLYNGAGYGGDDSTYNRGVTDEDILPLPVTNFAEISKEQRRQHQQA